MGPDNTDVTLETAFRIEDMAKRRMPIAEIARRERLPYWRVEAICKDAKVGYRP